MMIFDRVGFQTRNGVPDIEMGFQTWDGTRSVVPDMEMGFQTSGWGSRHGDGVPGKKWGSRHGDGVPDMGMGFQTRSGVSDMEMGFQTWGWDSRQEVGFQKWGRDSRNGDGIPDMGMGLQTTFTSHQSGILDFIHIHIFAVFFFGAPTKYYIVNVNLEIKGYIRKVGRIDF